MNIKFLKAHKGDCFLISFEDTTEVKRNIIIDGGMDGTYYDPASGQYGELKAEIDAIKIRKENIDLLVLTHIDNDHICGFLRLFQMDINAPTLIKNVWFNSGKLIAETLNSPQNDELDLELKLSSTLATGVQEAVAFEDFLLRNKIWERKLILMDDEIDVHGATFQILSPSTIQLNKLMKEYHEKTGDDVYTGAGEKDWNTDIKIFIDERRDKKYRFKQDKSVKNGSSISFVLSLGKEKFLFLADSHPVGITRSPKKLGYTPTNPLLVNFMKVSHHGSKANTNKESLASVSTENYLISTDSSGHGHPNKQTLARIIGKNPNAVLPFAGIAV